jgi:DNA-binding NarL/FixJ family response regulator
VGQQEREQYLMVETEKVNFHEGGHCAPHSRVPVQGSRPAALTIKHGPRKALGSYGSRKEHALGERLCTGSINQAARSPNLSVANLSVANLSVYKRNFLAGANDQDFPGTSMGCIQQEYFMRSRLETSASDRPESAHEIAPASSDSNQHGKLTERPKGDSQISVVVSDASFMTSELLAQALGRVKTLSIVKSAVSFGETLKAIVERSPDVAVVSTHLADGPYRGLEIVRQARQLSEKTRCIVLMDDSDREIVIDAFRAGARGVFKRSASMQLLSRCIAAVHSGQIWASSADLQQVLGALETAVPFRCVNSHGDALLTKREQEIVPLVAQGLTNKEISSRLGVSEHTVKNHLFRVYDKLGISSRVELILYAVYDREVAA